MAIISRFESKTHPDCGVACIVYKPGYGGTELCAMITPNANTANGSGKRSPNTPAKSGTYTVKDNWVTFHAGYAST